MICAIPPSVVRLLWLLPLVWGLCGCSNLRLPAIDPTGQQILLPAPAYTTLNDRTGYPGIPPSDHPLASLFPFPGPAFGQAAAIPPCERDFLPPAEASAAAPTTLEPDGLTPPQLPPPVVPRILEPTAAPGHLSQWTDHLHGPPQSDSLSRVTLNPKQLVAPVGTEVVLVGGVCGGDGYYRVREPLEWSLMQGSVGTFVDPGQPTGLFGSRGVVARLWGEPLPELLSTNYALGCTSKKTQVLTRGTVEPTDDIFVLEGQAWISLTSATEGNSYVGLIAPQLDGWQQRQQTAVIHWIDGQWTFPQPVVARPDAPATLVTGVTRKLTGLPVAGWIVRYEVVGGVPAVFSAGEPVQEVATNSLGQAAVQLSPASAAAGTTQVQIQLIRPALGPGQPDRLLVAQGTTTVTWASSRLQLTMSGPGSLQLGEVARYQIDVVNPGNIAAEQVVVRSLVPTGMEFVSAEPAGENLGSRVDWNLGSLAAGQRNTLQVQYRASQSGTTRHCAVAEDASGQRVEDCMTTQVTVQALQIEMLEPAEQSVQVGQTVEYRITVRNRGDRRLDDVLLIDRFDPGLRHAQGASPIEWPLGALEPGQMRQLGLVFEVIAPGRHCHTLEASATGTAPVEQSACVMAEPAAQPNLSVRKVGPNDLTIGSDASFYIQLENTGDVPLTGLQVVDQYDLELQVLEAEPAPLPERSTGNRLVWSLDRLDPGQTLTWQIRCRGTAEVDNACSRVFVTTAERIQRTDELCLPILARPAPAPAAGDPASEPATAPPLLPQTVPATPPAAVAGERELEEAGTGEVPREPAGGELIVRMEARGNEWRVGDVVEYLIVVRNDRQQVDRNVQLTLQLPAQAEFLDVLPRTVPGIAAASPDRRAIQLAPIRALRPGEAVQLRLQIRAQQPGALATLAQVTSLRQSEPVAVREDILILP